MSDETIRRISRRLVLGGGLAAAIGLALSQPGAAEAVQARGQAAAAQPAQAEELVFVNGRIHTMDAKNTIATTVTIRNGRFAAVGGARATRRPPDDESSTCAAARSCPASSTTTTTSSLMGNRPGYHTPLENALVDSPTCRRSSRRAPRHPARRVDHDDRRFPSQPARAAGRDAAPARRWRSSTRRRRTIPCTSRSAFNGPSATNSAGQEVLRKPDPADTGRRRRVDRRRGRRPPAVRRWSLRQTLLDAASSGGAAPSTR